MLSENQVRQLISENELLRIQLQDVNDMIAIREEELELLRKKAAEATMLQSKLENNLYELDFMQNELGKQQQIASGAAKREESLEVEVLDGIRMEKEFYTIREKLESARAELSDMQYEVSDMKHLNSELARLKTRIAELESNLDLLELDNSFMKEELAELRQLKEDLEKGQAN